MRHGFSLVEPKQSVVPAQAGIQSLQGFSLVELSIVLVILGLLAGGVLTGQSLIRAAELRSVTTEFSKYQAAVNTFRDKYFALPGDMPNATSFWGAAHATPATCITTAGTGTQTCNGNGDGLVVYNGTTSNESFRFWQQLANAGLIEGTYDGITHGATNYSATSLNSPKAKLGNAYWFEWHWQTAFSANAQFFDGQCENCLVLGGLLANDAPYTAILKPEDLWNIDTKIDDAKPANGKVLVISPGGLSNCTTATGSAAVQAATLSADYLLTNNSVACSILFRKVF